MRRLGIGVAIASVLILQGCASSQSKGQSGTAAPSPGYASSQPEKTRTAADRNLEILMQKIKADKKLLVASNMELTDAEAKQFWPIYDSYQKDLERINQGLGGTLVEYAEAYNSGPLPDSKAAKLLNQALDAEEAEVKLKQSYAEKLEAALPERKVARYIQIENKIRAAINGALAERIPLAY